MENQLTKEKLEHYNRVLHKQARIIKSKKIGISISSILYLVCLIAFVANLYLMIGVDTYFGFEQFNPYIMKVANFLPFKQDSLLSFGVSAFILLYAVPIAAAMIAYVLARILLQFNKSTEIQSVSLKTLNQLANKMNLNKSFKKDSKLKFSNVILAILFGVLMMVFSVLECMPIIEHWADWAVTIIGGVILSALMGLAALVVMRILTSLFQFVQKPLRTDNSKWWKNYRATCDECNKLISNINKEEARKKKEASEKQKAEEKRKKAEEREKANERRRQLAKEAEQKWAELEKPEENETLVQKLADEGSASACAYMGKKIYLDYVENAHTKKEKEVLIGRMTKYLKIADKEGDIDSRFLLLSIDVQTESHDLKTWKRLLSRARNIKQSGKLSEEYHGAYDVLIESLIEVIDRTEELSYERNNQPSFGGGSSSTTPSKPDAAYCRHWDGGYCIKGALKKCNGWCSDYTA